MSWKAQKHFRRAPDTYQVRKKTKSSHSNASSVFFTAADHKRLQLTHQRKTNLIEKAEGIACTLNILYETFKNSKESSVSYIRKILLFIYETHIKDLMCYWPIKNKKKTCYNVQWAKNLPCCTFLSSLTHGWTSRGPRTVCPHMFCSRTILLGLYQETQNTMRGSLVFEAVSEILKQIRKAPLHNGGS